MLLDSQNGRTCVYINREMLLNTFEVCVRTENIHDLRLCIQTLYKDIEVLQEYPSQREDLPPGENTDEEVTTSEPDIITYPKKILLSELRQILDARTISRSKYYIQRLVLGLSTNRTNGVNDINLYRWKEYDDVLTDSLWLINHRDRTGVHNADYWGNFIPQIPYQMLLRYTKAGEWVLDPFAGSGTTLIECRRLGRNALGIELNPSVAASSNERLSEEENVYMVETRIVNADSTHLDYQLLMDESGVSEVQLIIMHPPYHDIIQFSDDKRDLSNAPTVDDFIQSFCQVVRGTYPFLAEGRFLIVVIGDKYMQGEWIPLGFYTMQAVMEHGYKLKSIVVKNYEQTKGKRDQTQLWRYRALVGGFYIFKHEYIYIFQK